MNVNGENETQNVNNEQNAQNEDIAVLSDNTATATVEQVEQVDDPNEKIISDLFNAGKTEVTYEELRKAGFDSNRVEAYIFNIGQFTLSRFTLVSPYTIEKNT